MKFQHNKALMAGGILSCIAALIHIAAIIGGPDWYRFFGAGEEMAMMAARGDAYPIIITSFIAAILSVWAAYAFAGAGLIRRLPFMRFCLCAISFIYLARAIAGLVVVILMENPYRAEVRGEVTFMLVSSVIVLVYGLAYAVGTAQIWPMLSRKNPFEE